MKKWTRRTVLRTGTHFIVLPCLVLCTYCLLFFNKLKVGDNPASKQVHGRHVYNSICSLRVSVSHVGNFRSVSNFFLITIFVMTTCDKLLPLAESSDDG